VVRSFEKCKKQHVCREERETDRRGGEERHVDTEKKRRRGQWHDKTGWHAEFRSKEARLSPLPPRNQGSTGPHLFMFELGILIYIIYFTENKIKTVNGILFEMFMPDAGNNCYVTD
jgi:hypothetical protein